MERSQAPSAPGVLIGPEDHPVSGQRLRGDRPSAPAVGTNLAL